MANETKNTTSDGGAEGRSTLGIERYFTHGTHPFEEVNWVRRDALIPGVLEQRGVSFPEFYSQNAINIITDKYFSGHVGEPNREWSLKQLIGRVVETIGAAGMKAQPENGQPYFVSDEERTIFEQELAYILLHQMAAFNSPVWFNIGVPGVKQQASACFILSVDDHLLGPGSITDWYTKEAAIFKNGSGAGLNISPLRASKEPLEGGGYSSGPVTFMRAADASAGTITSGGRTRRAAKMVILDVDHPDVEDFIWCKALEERKAGALAAAGFDMSLNTPDGERNWASIQYQNANNSVRVTDEFLRAVESDDDWPLVARKPAEDGTPRILKTVSARELFEQLAEAAWECADPGVQYDTIINDWHTTPNFGRINGSNPCSEYMHVDNSSCNLASLNLMKFRKEDGSFNVEAFRHATRVLFTAQEILISFADYPTQEIGDNTRALRQIGIGYANLGAFLMSNATPYDSDSGRGWAAAITALLTGESYRQSALIASRVGPYAEYEANREPHLRVIKKHRQAANRLEALPQDPDAVKAAKRVWKEALEAGEQYGYRNAQASVLAPTGTISFMMDCDTTGIEPDFSLVKYKKLVGGGTMEIVNQTVPMALSQLGYGPQEIEDITEYIKANHGSITGAPHVQEAHYPIFACAVGDNSIHYRGHILMMAACQPFISGAISKTVNLPNHVSKEDVADIYLEGGKLGLKAVAIYRDGSKTVQPLGDGKDGKAAEAEVVTSLLGDGMLRGQKRELSDDPPVVARHFRVGQNSGYIHVHLFEDGMPGAIFVNVAQAGSDLRGMIDAWAITFSRALRYGTPLEDLVSKLAYAQFGGGFTNDPAIRSAKSIVDYVVRWLAKEFLDPSTHGVLGIDPPEDTQPNPMLAMFRESVADSGLVVDPDSSGEFQPSVELAPTPHFPAATAAPVSAPAPEILDVAVSGPSRETSPINGNGSVRKVEVKINSAGMGTCGICGGTTVQTGKCQTCTTCGATGGCG